MKKLYMTTLVPDEISGSRGSEYEDGSLLGCYDLDD
jgi:hypothetical protein